MDVPHSAASGRVRVRHVAEGCVEVHRRNEHVGRDHDRCRARHRATFRPVPPHSTSTAPTATARISSPTACIALDARTGKRLWHFQNVHHDLWDYDNTSAPQLTTIKQNGKTIRVVAMAGKTGFLYVFDRVTGKPMWPIEERPVPTKTEVPGEEVVADAAVSDHAAAVRAAEVHGRRYEPVHARPTRSASSSRSASRRRGTKGCSRRSASAK